MFAGPSRPRPDARHLAADGRPATTSGRRSGPPAHRAPTAGHSRVHEPLLAPSRRRRRPTPTPVSPTELLLEAADAEVSPLSRVQRSRLAFALAVTLAALPVVVLDNISATAETNDAPVEAVATVAESASWEATTETTAPSTTTTAAPTTTSVAPTTTEAPATTVTTEEVVVMALSAPAPAPLPPPPAPTTTAPPPPPAPSPGDPNDPATWDRLARCESSGNWAMNSGNGYYGGLQFSLATWRGVGGAGYPHQASKAEQINRGKILQARAGWGQWPHCARQLGYL